jgi:hypothetical protein
LFPKNAHHAPRAGNDSKAYPRIVRRDGVSDLTSTILRE